MCIGIDGCIRVNELVGNSKAIGISKLQWVPTVVPVTNALKGTYMSAEGTR